MRPALGNMPVASSTGLPLTFTRSTEPRLTISMVFHSPRGFSRSSLALVRSGPALALAVVAAPAPAAAPAPGATPAERVRTALAGLAHPVSQRRLRELCRIRSGDLGGALDELVRRGEVVRSADGYRHLGASPVSPLSPPVG